jgi:hypothetical protein
MNNKGHSDLGQVLGLILLILVVAGILDLSLIVLAIISFIKWSSGLGVILLISALVVSLVAYWLLKRIE